MGEFRKIRIGVLTSSRADFGIYLPLLHQMRKDNTLGFKLIVFGTHLSKFHGFTVNQIVEEGFEADYSLNSMLQTDDPNSISSAYALTCLKFADFWANNKDEFDIIFALGDRYEMAAAVVASIPFVIPIAHIHGGETTLGAIDNIYRHSISLASSIQFVSTVVYKERIRQLLGTDENCHISGSLSLENLELTTLLTIEEFKSRFDIDLSLPSILVTVHPETVSYQQNFFFAEEMYFVIETVSTDYQVIITLPNADTSGTTYREIFQKFKDRNSNVKLIENFGTQSYFTCIKYSKLLVGNTSSGIIEAASFGKYAINIGDRQRGRLRGSNIIDVPFDHQLILEGIAKYAGLTFLGENLYYKSNPSARIIHVIKKYFDVSISESYNK